MQSKLLVTSAVAAVALMASGCYGTTQPAAKSSPSASPLPRV